MKQQSKFFYLEKLNNNKSSKETIERLKKLVNLIA